MILEYLLNDPCIRNYLEKLRILPIYRHDSHRVVLEGSPVEGLPVEVLVRAGSSFTVAERGRVMKFEKLWLV